MNTAAHAALIERRLDAVLTVLRQGERTIHEIADAVHMHREHVRSHYVNRLIAEGLAHIIRTGRGPKHSGSNAYPIYAFGPVPDGVPRCHKAQLAMRRAEDRSFFGESLSAILAALSYDDMDIDEIVVATHGCWAHVKRRVDFLIDQGKVHVLCRERRPGKFHGRYVYSIGPGPRRMPETAEGQYMRARKAYKAAQEEEAERRRDALRQPARVDIAAAWFAPQPTKRQEIRA